MVGGPVEIHSATLRTPFRVVVGMGSRFVGWYLSQMRDVGVAFVRTSNNKSEYGDSSAALRNDGEKRAIATADSCGMEN